MWVLVAASAIGAALAGARPTAWGPADVAWSAAIGAGAAAAGSVARTWGWLAASGLAALLAPGRPVLGLGALGVALVYARSRDVPYRRAAGAVVGALTAQALLRIEGGPFGWSAAGAGVSLGILAAASSSHLRSRTRRSAHRWVVVALAGGGLATASYAVAGFQAHRELGAGVAAAAEGLSALGAGRTQEAEERLERAGQLLADAHRHLASPLARPALAVPGLGPQARALDRATGAGAELAQLATDVVRDADPAGLGPVAGRFNLERLRALGSALDALVAGLERSGASTRDAGSGWLLPTLAAKLDRLSSAVASARVQAGEAARAVALLPGLLGGDGPRRYLILVGNPAETRALGGFVPAFAEIVADGGRLDLGRVGDIAELNQAGGERRLTDPATLPEAYRSLHPETYWQNVTGTSDFPTVAAIARDMWPQSGGGPLDGIIYTDVEGLAAVLRLTGPVPVAGLEAPVSADTVGHFVTIDQYERFEGEADRKDRVVDIGREVFRRMTSLDQGNARAIVDAFAPVLAEGRLLLESGRPEEQRLFTDLGVAGSMPRPGGGDLLAVRTTNAGANKIDALLYREIDYRVTVDPVTGRATATLDVTLANRAPDAGLPAYVIGNDKGLPVGSNLLLLEVATPLGLERATLGSVAMAVSQAAEYGCNVYRAFLWIPAGQQVTATLHLGGTLADPGGYRLVLASQPVVNADLVTVEVEGTPGWTADDARYEAVVGGGTAIVATTFTPN